MKSCKPRRLTSHLMLALMTAGAMLLLRHQTVCRWETTEPVLSHHNQGDFSLNTRPLASRRTRKGNKLSLENKTIQSQRVETMSAGESIQYNPYIAMRERASKVRQICTNSGFQHSNKEIEEAIYLVTDSSYEILYKPIPKIGWTTWIWLLFENGNLLKSVGRPIKGVKWEWGWDTPYQFIDFSRLESASATKLYKERFLISRSPWDRLVSGYKNKALEGDFAYKFHRPCAWLQKRKPKLTFRQFVKCILDRAKASGKTLSSADAALRLNPHWQPLYTMALPCVTNYTMIGEFDHFSEDSEAALDMLNLNAKIRHKNPTKHASPLSDWYNALDSAMIEELRELYRHDFGLFGYDSTPPNQKSQELA